MAPDLVEERGAEPIHDQNDSPFSKGDPSEAEVLFLAFISLLQFYRTVFHFKSFFLGRSWNSFDGMLLFPLGIWNSLFYPLVSANEMARKPQIYRFSILFLPVLYLVSPCWGRSFRLYAADLHFLQMQWSMRSLSESNL